MALKMEVGGGQKIRWLRVLGGVLVGVALRVWAA
jgi:hypothetical protein